jgi:hypothetical protein
VLIAPAKFSEAEGLAYYRTHIGTVLEQFDPNGLAIKTVEANARGNNQKRIRIEGVIMECGAARRIPVLAGPLITIGSRLGIKAKDAKATLDGPEFRGLEWPKGKPLREAILSAAAAAMGG